MFSVNSEVGRLREVVVHRPGTELSRLTPSNVDSMLFDDVLWAERAREEHDLFAKQLVDQGVVVHHFADLLAEALDVDDAREFVATRLATHERFGQMLAGAIGELVRTYPAARLAEILIGGLTKRDVEAWVDIPSLLLQSAAPDDFILSPLPNHLFQRDNSAWIYGALSVNPMAKEARQRETINSRVVYNFHPMFRSAPPTFLYGNDSAVHLPATVEGGDVAVLGHRAVMIGMGERTTSQGIELLSQRLFETGTAERVIVVELPKERAFMHLDTALTQVDRDAYSVYPYLPETLRSWHVTPERGGLAFHENDDLFRELSFALQVDEVRALKVPMDRRAAEREQWDDGNNFLAVAPGVVLGCERNTTTNHYLEEHGITVLPVVGSELGRGRGGPRCLTCPISREA
ncbi:MAG TPA: arginine deiminase [Nocardioides sp.]|uniref:arginine deiminase n=1 Tax=Nocardioides sp. TaxID=35761 RepID=UPI002E2F8AD0|nr:arginine deiminase [Nocardioides sp.]HEX5087099.1 arginine deiminase [Nocardioides sp.]